MYVYVNIYVNVYVYDVYVYVNVYVDVYFNVNDVYDVCLRLRCLCR